MRPIQAGHVFPALPVEIAEDRNRHPRHNQNNERQHWQDCVDSRGPGIIAEHEDPQNSGADPEGDETSDQRNEKARNSEQ